MVTSVKLFDMELGFEERPWGRFYVLDDMHTHKVKRIEVNPASRISYQYHMQREEFWTIVSGKARVTIEGTDKILSAGDTIHIPKEALHRIENISDVSCIFIEVQLGTYFGEDDIIRIQDDYNRENE